jgi:hypothetical protein
MIRIFLALALAAGVFSVAQAQQLTPSDSFSVAKTASIGTTAVLVSGSDNRARRTIRNTGSIACEIMPAATAYGTGHPLPAGESFTFDASGRTTAALYVACASAGGSVSVISY